MRAWPINAEWGEAQRMTCLNRTGRHPQTARANVVIWADGRVGHVVDTTSPKPQRQRKPRHLDRAEDWPWSQINPHSSNSLTPSAVTATLFGGSPAPTSHPLTSA